MEGIVAMRWEILLLSIALCGCAADDQMRVLATTPEGIEAWAWTQAYSKQAMTEMAQQYCQRDGRNAQIKDSEVAEKHLLKGSRVVYRFNCVR